MLAWNIEVGILIHTKSKKKNSLTTSSSGSSSSSKRDYNILNILNFNK